MGAPTKRTEAARALIVEILRGGSTRKAAYTAAGLSHDTFYLWLKEDQDFAQDVEEARQDFISESVRSIVAQGKQDWRALAWLLPRLDPEHFADKIELTRMTDDELLAEAAAIAKGAGDPRGDAKAGAEATVDRGTG